MVLAKPKLGTVDAQGRNQPAAISQQLVKCDAIFRRSQMHNILRGGVVTTGSA
jgi:hypothetical protein